jgi:hypothetical protein
MADLVILNDKVITFAGKDAEHLQIAVHVIGDAAIRQTDPKQLGLPHAAVTICSERITYRA